SEMGIAQLVAQRAKTKNSIGKLLDSEKATLDTLTAQQQAAVQAASLGGGGTGTSGGGSAPPPVNNVPTSSQAGKAVAFASPPPRCPYRYGRPAPRGRAHHRIALRQAARAGPGGPLPP